MKILIVDDDQVSRKLLKKLLKKYNHEPVCAKDGEEAWSILSADPGIRLVIADWIMPRSSGLDLCQKIRKANFPHYIYIILLTSKHQKQDIVKGLEVGADDYITKPFEPSELRVRIHAGVRIIQLEEHLFRNNQKLQDLIEILQGDLTSGKEAQESFLPKSFPKIPEMEFAARFIPSLYVSGDVYNIFSLDEQHIGLYNIDVSGHGVSAALFSTLISQRMTYSLHSRGFLKNPTANPPFYQIKSPENVIKELDLEDMLDKYNRYFTMVYAITDIKKGEVSFCRAGHNYPLIIHGNGDAEYIKGGGPPIGLGLLPMERKAQRIKLKTGDRFILFSDGLSEACHSRGDVSYGLQKVKEFLVRHIDRPLDECFDLLIRDAKQLIKEKEFSDDVSILGFHWSG